MRIGSSTKDRVIPLNSVTGIPVHACPRPDIPAATGRFRMLQIFLRNSMCFFDHCCFYIVAGSIGALLMLTLIVMYCHPEKENEESTLERYPPGSDRDILNLPLQQDAKQAAYAFPQRFATPLVTSLFFTGTSALPPLLRRISHSTEQAPADLPA